jgi:pyocin large subunit-like protein
MELPAATTRGRADTLADHFARHGGDFGAASEAEYAQQASRFFQRGIGDGLPTKINPKDGSIRIYDPQSNTFGAYNADGSTRTFYKPDPARRGFATNWDYWVSQPGYAP